MYNQMISRTEHTKRNIIAAVVVQIVNIVIKFVVRTIFIYTLGKEYLGVGGVFNNILTVLSLAELGLGTVIVYDMYRPISENNETRVTQLYQFYRDVYAGIGIFIAALGSLLIPFLGYLITDVLNVENIRFLYVLHLADSVATYFFAHSRSLLNAYQLNRINSRNTLLMAVLKTVLEIVALIVTKSYVIYMLVQIFVTIYGGYLLDRKAKQLFPFVKNKVEKLDSASKRGIFSNAFSMMNIRISQTLINATDNLLVSAMISTVLVGIYSNYSMITQIILTTAFLIESSMAASVGNLCVSEGKEKKREVFARLQYLYSCLFGVIMISLFGLFNPFIKLWLGTEYLLSEEIVFIIVLNCYLSGMHQPVEAYVNADGVFKHFRFKPTVEVFINFVVSIVGAKLWGIVGVFLGTTFSHVLTTLWFDPYVLYKYSFSNGIRDYFNKYFKSLLLAVIMTLVTSKFVSLVTFEGIIGFIIDIIVCGAAALVFIVVNTDYNNRKWLKDRIKSMLKE